METLLRLLNGDNFIVIKLGEIAVTINVLLIIGIIIFIEVLKQTINSVMKDKKINPNIWKIIVLIAGFICTSIQFGIDGLFSNFNFLVWFAASIIYSGLATILYQTGKLGANSIQNNKNEKN